MRNCSMGVWLVVCALMAIATGLEGAEDPPEGKGTVTGQGVVELKRQPELLRVQIEILAKGKDLKAALAKLKERREAAQNQLAKLGVVNEAVTFSEPMLTSEKTDRQRQMEMMVRDRLKRDTKKPDPKSKQPPEVFVSATLKAEFPLKASTPEDLLLVSTDLQEKIKAADLAGKKELKQLSPQEEELAEEAAEIGAVREEGEPPRGEPIFLFVSKISEEDHAKALAEAYQKAKREAGRLARAASTELGALHHLDKSSQAAADFDDGSSMYDRRAYYRMRELARSNQGGDEQASEAIGVQPGKATFRVMVSASFLLKKPADPHPKN